MSDKGDHLYQAVKEGFTNGSRYDKYRPDYTPETTSEIVHMLTSVSRMSRGGRCDILELGAGTGKLTKHLMKYLPTFVATEPMSNFLTTLRSNCPGVDTVQCTAESIPFQDNSVQDIVASQCFHWFSNEVAMQEITRVLKPDGCILLVWIYPDLRVDWVDAVNTKALTFKHDNEPRYSKFLWKAAIDEFPGLKLKSRTILDYPTREYTVDDLLNFYSTMSAFARMCREEKQKALSELEKVVSSHPSTAGQDVLQFPSIVDVYQYVNQ